MIEPECRPDDRVDRLCFRCGGTLNGHGWLRESGEGKVCPGDYIVRNVAGGRRWVFKKSIFLSDFIEVEKVV